MSKKTYFTVVGSGPFPLDMMRYDECDPHSDTDRNYVTMDTINMRASESRRAVQLSTSKPGAPTLKRWESFGWLVRSVDLDKPIRELHVEEPTQWVKVAGLDTWALVTNDPRKQGGAWQGQSGDFRGRAIIGTSDTEARHPTLTAAMCWVEQELRSAPAEDETEERAFRAALAKWSRTGKLLDLCDAIDAGYEAEHSGLDDDMAPLLVDLSENTAAIQNLVDAARDVFGTASNILGGDDEPAYVRDHLEALDKALKLF